jgi:NDP-sugar pyrophosphorylase family protein
MMDVVILCGGEGTRLRQVSGDKQKVLMPVKGHPFISLLIDSLLPFGFRRFILCTGYQKDQIHTYFKDLGYDVLFSDEYEPLGTGGAIKNARPYIGSSSFIVLNGDSICRTDYNSLMGFHNKKNGIMTLVLAKPLTEVDYGSVMIDDQYRVIEFREKVSAQVGGYINAGIYVMNHDIFNIMPDVKKFSLEYDLMPTIIPHGCYGFVTNGTLIDIGTPGRYLLAHNLLS